MPGDFASLPYKKSLGHGKADIRKVSARTRRQLARSWRTIRPGPIGVRYTAAATLAARSLVQVIGSRNSYQTWLSREELAGFRRPALIADRRYRSVRMILVARILLMSRLSIMFVHAVIVMAHSSV